MTGQQRPARTLTGRHVLAITVGAFAIIIAVNLFMAYKAISSFPGLEVPNSYVASQQFDRNKAAQLALGWTLTHSYRDGVLRLSFRDRTGQPVEVASLTAVVGRTTESAEDKTPAFRYEGGDYLADIALGQGRWMILLDATSADGTLFHQRLNMSVPG